MKVNKTIKIQKGRAFTILIITALLLFSFRLAHPKKLTPAQERGKSIYEQGLSLAENPLIARMSGVEVPASVLPCASCHGLDGQGNPEGGLSPSNLTWAVLSNDFTVQNLQGRQRKAYDEFSLLQAIRMGTDPSGNTLHEAMPRYQIPEEDLEDLIAYLKILGSVDDPGLSDDNIRVGITLPPEVGPESRGKAIHAVVSAYLDLINSGGGIYSRKIELRPFEMLPDAEANQNAFDTFLEKEDLFAFTANTLEEQDGVCTQMLKTRNLPVIGAISGNPSSRTLENGEIFYLLPGLEQEIAALLNHAMQYFKKNQLTVLYSDESLLKNLTSHNTKTNFPNLNLMPVSYGKTISKSELESFKNSKQEIFLLLGNINWQEHFIKKAANLDWYPNILMPGKYATPDLLNAPKGFQQKIWLSYPTWMNQRNDKALQLYAQLASVYQLPKSHLQSQLHALAAVILFTETLKVTGRDLSRAKLIKEVEALQDFQTGYTPPLTYGLNRRIGSEKVFIVTPDLEKQSLVLVNE